MATRHADEPVSFYDELVAGRLRFDLLCPFPEQQPSDRAAGDTVIAELEGLLATRVDSDLVDRLGKLPGGVLDDLRYRGYLSLGAPVALGGLNLSRFNVFRAITAAAISSPPIALVLAIANGLGASAYMSALPSGPLRDYLAARVAEGVVSGTADTELAGAANRDRMTIAEPSPCGTAYLLHGQKVFAGNGTIADVLAVSATVREGSPEEVRLFFVETSSPGVEVHATHEFLGFRGAPNGAVRFNAVRVPRERMFPVDQGWRQSDELAALGAVARMFIIAAPSLAIARHCMEWSRRFVARRRIDGRALAEYGQIQRIIATSMAEVFAIESLIEWSMLGAGGVDTRREQAAAKNITSMTCWRIVDRTMSLLAAEGYETALSKEARGAEPLPLERAFRDARALRIAGGVDFQVDNWAAEAILSRYLGGHCSKPGTDASAALASAGLPGRNAMHLRFVADAARAFAQTIHRYVERRPSPDWKVTEQSALVLLGRLANELVTMPIVLARGKHLAERGQPGAHALADTYCLAARRRVDSLQRQLADIEQWGWNDLPRPMLESIIARPASDVHGCRF
jgi:alkylation response protein AidB-like acyl-CoA dehydrogenase